MAYVITASCTGCTACVRLCPVAAIRGVKDSVHAIDAKRCIECGACGRVCPASAVADDAGMLVARLRISSWPRPEFDLGTCIGCASCAEACPVSCLVMEGGSPGGLGETPRLLDSPICVSCGRCADICPVRCVVLKPPVGAGEPGARRRAGTPGRSEGRSPSGAGSSGGSR